MTSPKPRTGRVHIGPAADRVRPALVAIRQVQAAQPTPVPSSTSDTFMLDEPGFRVSTRTAAPSVSQAAQERVFARDRLQAGPDV